MILPIIVRRGNASDVQILSTEWSSVLRGSTGSGMWLAGCPCELAETALVNWIGPFNHNS